MDRADGSECIVNAPLKWGARPADLYPVSGQAAPRRRTRRREANPNGVAVDNVRKAGVRIAGAAAALARGDLRAASQHLQECAGHIEVADWAIDFERTDRKLNRRRTGL